MGHMDVYWDTASRMVTVMSIVISACLFVRFLRPFLNRGRCAWEAGIAYMVVLLAAYVIPQELPGMIPDAMGIMAVFAVICLRDGTDRIGHQINSGCLRPVRNKEQKIFLAVVMYLVEWFAHGIALPFRDVWYRVILFSPKVMRIHPMAYWGLYIAVETVCLGLRFVIMYFLFRVIEHAYTYKKENISKKELGLLLTVPLSVVAGYSSFTYFFEIYLNDIRQYIQDRHVLYNSLKALYQIISFAAIFSSIVLYQKIKESYRQEKEKAVLKEQTESMKKYVAEVEALYRNIRGLKHDMGNHVMILENLCQNNRQEAMDYLLNLKEELHEAVSEIRTGNPITDVIISDAQKEASEKGIRFSCDFHYPEGTAVNAFDMGIIVSNGVKNAIEGSCAHEKPFIRIRSYQEKNAYLIEINNNFKGNLLLSGDGRLPETTKENGKEHGFGLANMRRVARKYFGDVQVRADGEVFTLNVMLMLK